MNLTQASRQWAERPADERFFNLPELRDACKHYADSAKESSANPSEFSMRFASSTEEEKFGDDLRLMVNPPGGQPRSARFTHWSFGQFCRQIQAPADYLRQLPTLLTKQNLDHGIARWQADKARVPVQLLTHRNGDNLLRAITSTGYSRIWNHEVADRLLELNEDWIVPPARPAFGNQPGTRKATRADVLPNQGDFGLSVKVGDEIAPAGLYASDHDMFCFLVNEKCRINDGSALGMARGIFVSNSEVGAQSLKITKFRYRHVCGNHIVWDASDVLEVRIIHRGLADARYVEKLQMELTRYGDEGVEEEERLIKAAQRLTFGKDKKEVLDVLFGMKSLGANKGQLDAAFDLADVNSGTDGNPRSAWGMAQGLTRLSQQGAYMDQRTAIDRVAGRILELAK